jgi:sec-independent protein translocase protein TatA
MIPLFAFGMPGFQDWVLILIIVLVLFGAKRLPELARSLAQSMHEFRKAKDEFERELHKTTQDAPPAVRSESDKEPPKTV